jgi:hypothetical protein
MCSPPIPRRWRLKRPAPWMSTPASSANLPPGLLRGLVGQLLGGERLALRAIEKQHPLRPDLDPEVVLRSDGGVARPALISLVRGAHSVAERAMAFRYLGETATRILVNGIPGAVAWAPDGSPFAVVTMTVKGGRIVVIDALAEPDRLGRLDLTVVAR